MGPCAVPSICQKEVEVLAASAAFQVIDGHPGASEPAAAPGQAQAAQQHQQLAQTSTAARIVVRRFEFKSMNKSE